MARRHGDTHRLIRWLWTSRRLDARLARLGLLPAAALWRAGMGLRELSFRRGWRASHALPLPSVAVGNLTVGGSGKTPDRRLDRAALRARGAAGRASCSGATARDEVLVHRHDVPEAVVVAESRPAGRGRARRGRGAPRCWCWTTPSSGSTSGATSTSWW